MSISGSTVFEVRPSVGNDNNGGGFVTGGSGTDWSQQTSPQYALTGLASAGSGNTVLYASASADMVGNIANVVSGTNFNTGMFQITSVSLGVSITFSTNQSNASICTGVGVSGVINIGGSLATLGQLPGNYTSGNTVYIKVTGTITLTSSLSYGNGDIAFIGYTTTRGDNGQATITTSTNSVNGFTPAGGMLLSVYNIILTCTAGTPGFGIINSNNFYSWGGIFVNCVFSGWGATIAGGGVGVKLDPLIFIDCEIKNNLVGTFVDNSQALYFLTCYIHDNTGVGVNLNSQNQRVTFEGCVIANNGAEGIKVTTTTNPTSVVNFHNCAIVNNTGDGFAVQASQTCSDLIIWNTIFSKNGGWGINNASSNTIYLVSIRNNAFFSNTSGTHTGTGIVTTSDVTLIGDPFTNASGGDYSLNATSGAGAACKSAGYQSTLV